jgi:hypothetical protein
MDWSMAMNLGLDGGACEATLVGNRLGEGFGISL